VSGSGSGDGAFYGTGEFFLWRWLSTNADATISGGSQGGGEAEGGRSLQCFRWQRQHGSGERGRSNFQFASAGNNGPSSANTYI